MIVHIQAIRLQNTPLPSRRVPHPPGILVEQVEDDGKLRAEDEERYSATSQ